MNNEQILQMLKGQKNGVEIDLTRSQYELEFLLELSEKGELPSFAQGNLEHYQEEVPLFEKKCNWLDLKIEELTAIIENTN